jgi:hypothetical protein
MLCYGVSAGSATRCVPTSISPGSGSPRANTMFTTATASYWCEDFGRAESILYRCCTGRKTGTRNGARPFSPVCIYDDDGLETGRRAVLARLAGGSNDKPDATAAAAATIDGITVSARTTRAVGSSATAISLAVANFPTSVAPTAVITAPTAVAAATTRMRLPQRLAAHWHIL